MAYDKHVWTCGEAITTEKLNHMEDGIASGGGYECTQSEVMLTNESVTTGLDNAYLSYTDLIDADTLIVYFDGTRYECPKISNANYNAYGGYTSEGDTDFSEYPFAIRSKTRTEEIEYRNSAYAQTAGSHTIELKTIGEVVNTTECFEKAVKKFTGYECKEEYIEVLNDTITTTKSDESPNPPDTTFDSLFIDADHIKVTFDGVEYECDAKKTAGIGATFYMYGSTEVPRPTFENYPFRIVSSGKSGTGKSGTRIATKTAGDYNVKIQALGIVATTSECFDTVTRKAVNASGKCVQLRVGYTDETKQEFNDPIIPTEINYRQFKNTEAISIAQGQYGTVTLYAITTTKINMMFAIMNIYVADNGHLPPITSIRTEPDPNNNGKVVYKVEMYARDSAISIAKNKLILDALSFEPPLRTTSFCVVEGTCCEDRPT